MSNFLSALLGQAQAATAPGPRVVGRPTTDEEEAQIDKWLAEKAKKYPEGLPQERVREWQEFDRKRFQEHFAQLRAAPVQAPPQMGTLQHLMRGGDW
ncbi:MAG TPA: hypothetical protein VM686_37435 [Polyangiaceae bacterium]|jgi:hypothetical protein|nr:hypothetical protein [Gemmatimonadaceae bacterium]HVJ21173.1 hypothetical protein [Polyangiaceae bacterium]